MTGDLFTDPDALIARLCPLAPVLIAGPTASGKSALALAIAQRQGGVIVNADASQVYDCWQTLTARPTQDEMEGVPHHLYGHLPADAPYSVGHWLRELRPLLEAGPRPIIVGGTGLYFMALTQGLADIPATPPAVRARGDALSLGDMLAQLDPETIDRIDTANRARVQRAWEVQHATGRNLTDWQADTGTPMLATNHAQPIVFDTPRDWLNDRIERRFDLMLAAGALDEARTVLPTYDPSLPAHRAIGAPELIAHLRGDMTLPEARERAIIATRQFAKRQRTWFRSKMSQWRKFSPQ
ncbi:tRNA (adenosine(37)-N6)-dimethylallyltransferase MiaA [Roseobacter sp.]|uniref:tRNA (adenosine(37)-N6)-dimethylallyltransferase MiaA n=1 Tax=Roseobacter sp. TaxID=1907202 RepID=UPI003296BEEE